MATNNRYALILAGGRGTRFWPRSRTRHPKQLIPVVAGKTLIQETVDRLRPLVPPERMWILTNQVIRREVIRQLPEIPRRQVLAEPVARNTAPAIGLAAQVLQSIDQDAVLGIFPSDHYIARPSRFRPLAKAAYRGAEAGNLMVLGIEPRWPETGYGYLEFPPGTTPGDTNPAPIRSFREKPDLRTAQRFLKAKRFYWNAGMFFWRAGVFLEELRKHLPQTASLLASLPRYGSRKFGPALRDIFPRTESISVDYAVMERAEKVAGIAAGDIGWNDLGSWNAAYELLADAGGANVAHTDALLISSSGNYIDAPGKLVAALGVDDLILVDTPDAILIASRSRAQQVGEIVKVLEKLNRKDLL